MSQFKPKKKNSCNHDFYQCKSCGGKGCNAQDCPNQLILDSNNPYSDNFEHGSGYKCNKCEVEHESFSFTRTKQ